jgi:hypothetical protein
MMNDRIEEGFTARPGGTLKRPSRENHSIDQGQPGLHRKTLSPQTKNKNKDFRTCDPG